MLPLVMTSPARLEPGQQLGGGRLGQPGELAELGPRQRPVLEQQVEGGAVVDAAEHPAGRARASPVEPARR